MKNQQHILLTALCLMQIVAVYIEATGLTVTTQPQSLSVQPGSNGDLACKFDGPAPNCIWHKDKEQIQIAERYVMMGDPQNGDCSLQIQNANLEFDDGMWYCGIPAASGDHGLYSQDAKFTVYAEPTAPIIYQNGQPLINGSIVTTDLSPNSSSSFYCRSEKGNPEAHLAFQNLESNFTYTPDPRDNNKTFISTAYLTRSLNAFDTRILTCEMIHQSLDYKITAYVAVRQPVPLTDGSVKAKSATPNSIDQTTFTAIPGSTVSLVCSSNAVPVPNYSWEKRSSDGASWYSFLQGSNISFTAEQAQYSCLANDATGANKIRSNTVTINIATGAGMTVSQNTLVILGSLLFALLWAFPRNMFQS